jgi:hypothetical protein
MSSDAIKAFAQLCAFPSLEMGILSAIEIYQQLSHGAFRFDGCLTTVRYSRQPHRGCSSRLMPSEVLATIQIRRGLPA